MITNDITLLLKELGIQKNKAILLPSDGEDLNFEFEISPEEFLEQAEQDYETNGNSAFLNSITNAKRAIRSQIDKVLYCLGFDARKMGIKQKMERLKELGVITPRMLKKVDVARNLLEHEYKSPSLQEVEDALDLAALFIEATNRTINPIGSFFVLGNEDEYIEGTVADFKNRITFDLDVPKKQFQLSGNTAISGPDSVAVRDSRTPIGESVIVTNADPMYISIMRLAIVVEKDYENKARKAINCFFDALQ